MSLAISSLTLKRLDVSVPALIGRLCAMTPKTRMMDVLHHGSPGAVMAWTPVTLDGPNPSLLEGFGAVTSRTATTKQRNNNEGVTQHPVNT